MMFKARFATAVILSIALCRPVANANTASGQPVVARQSVLAGQPPTSSDRIASSLFCDLVYPLLARLGIGETLNFGKLPAPAGDAFYTPPTILPGCTHGDAVWSRRLDNPTAALSDGNSRLVLYRSEDLFGNPIATSGMIALPKTPPPAGGYPVISWAHGTVGVADSCAPTRDQPGSTAHPMNAYPQALLNHFLDMGWAVAMTDYEGLGTTDRTHPYLLGESEAHSVLDIVRVARHLFGPVVSDRYAIVGHSQGGQAALFSAHYAPTWAPDLHLVGVAAVAPANHSLPLVKVGAGLTAKLDGFGFTPLLLTGAIAGDPTINPAQVLSDTGYQNFWPQVDQRCRAGLSAPDSWGGLMGTQQFRAGYLTSPNADQQKFNQQILNMNPNVSFAVPVRISQAADDQRVFANPAPLPGTDTLVTELNATNQNTGNTVVYQRYPAGVVPPDPVLGVHFATINYDTTALITWLSPLLR